MIRRMLIGANFLSAFLLFIVQPLYAKHLLPYFGGTASVWTISIFFYSGVLLMGYLYASVLTGWSLKTARWVHSTILILAAALLIGKWLGGNDPLLVASVGATEPAIDVFLTLLYAVGLPVLLLASTSVLTQHLYAKLTNSEPYWLFALSNAGSLLGLLCYPFLVEPLFDLTVQTRVWTGSFLVFLFLLLTAWRQVERSGTETVRAVSVSAGVSVWGRIILMAAIPTFLLASSTELLSRGIASFPLLWVVPLAVYLVSFILAFRTQETWKWRFPLSGAIALLLLPTLLFLLAMNSGALPFWLAFGFTVLTVGLISWYFHRRIYELRPNTAQLGGFFVLVTIGGVLGSGVVGLLMPVILDRLIELHLVLVLLFFHFTAVSLRWLIGQPPRLISYLLRGTLVVGVLSLAFSGSLAESVLDESRNFYGTVRVVEYEQSVDGELVRIRGMVHGSTVHGLEVLEGEFQSTAASYYGPDSGIDLTVRDFTDRGQPPRLAVVGLGAGMMNAYCDDISRVDYIEINPEVITLAEDYFSYLGRCAAKTNVIIGDGRLVLEGIEQEYDIIMLDAFSDDAIPVHMLTREAFLRAYLPNLASDGIIAVHITNRYLDLSGPVIGTAESVGLSAFMIHTEPPSGKGVYHPTTWVLLKREPVGLSSEIPEIQNNPPNSAIVWTDGRYSVLEALSLQGSGQ